MGGSEIWEDNYYTCRQYNYIDVIWQLQKYDVRTIKFCQYIGMIQ